MTTIEELRQRHRHQLITAAFRIVHGFSPDEATLHHWMQRLSSGLDAPALLRELRIQGPVPSASPSLLAGATPHIATLVAPAHAVGNTSTEIEDIAINDLLGLPDEDFAQAIYHRFLGRQVDAESKRNVLLALGNGIQRWQIAKSLAHSKEGKQYRLKLVGATQADPMLVDTNHLASLAKFYIAQMQMTNRLN